MHDNVTIVVAHVSLHHKCDCSTKTTALYTHLTQKAETIAMNKLNELIETIS